MPFPAKPGTFFPAFGKLLIGFFKLVSSLKFPALLPSQQVMYKFVSGEGLEAEGAALSMKCHLYLPHLAGKADRL